MQQHEEHLKDSPLSNTILSASLSSSDQRAVSDSLYLPICAPTDCRSSTEIKPPHSSFLAMAAAFDPWAQQIFNISREFILSYPTPPIQIAHRVTRSTTRSVYRLQWNWIASWDNFGALVHHYWNNIVTQNDKQTNVYTQGAYTDRVQGVAMLNTNANEGDIKGRIDAFVVPVHTAAANGLNGAPRPSDLHSLMQRWEPGVQANQLAGIPDFVFAAEQGNPRRVTAVFEVKNPWHVTPARIEEVISSI